MPAAICAALVAAHYPNGAEADRGICANCARVLARRVDREAMMSTLLEQPFRGEPQRGGPQPSALALRCQKDVQAGVTVVGIGLFVVPEPPRQRAIDLDRKRSVVVDKTLPRVLGIVQRPPTTP